MTVDPDEIGSLANQNAAGNADHLKGPFTIHERDEQLTGILEDYLAELETGRVPDKRDLQQRYPELADLADFLQGLDFIHHVVPQLKDANQQKDAEMQPLATLGDFRVVREIGRGGMGVVYEAAQLALGRRVALKILPFASMLDDRGLERFKNEARAAAMLRHPNIVGVHSVGCERGVHYYAMELVQGQSLAQVVAQLRARGDNAVAQSECPDETQPFAALSTQRREHRGEYYRSVTRLGAQIAEALDYAHEQGVVHRDIKPSNLLLDHRGNVWISDFGLAQIKGDHNLTMTGDLVGTLRYMSPEQAEGRKLLDHRTDIYSLGVTTLLAVARGHNRGVHGISFPDGTGEMLSGGRDGRLIAWDLQQLLEGDVLRGRFYRASFTSDGRQILAAADDGEIQMIDSQTGHRDGSWNEGAKHQTVAFSEDGGIVAAIDFDRRLCTSRSDDHQVVCQMNIDGMNELDTPIKPGQEFQYGAEGSFPAAVSCDGTMFALPAREADVPGIALFNVEKRKRRFLKGDRRPAHAIAFSPSGDALIGVLNGWRLWNLDSELWNLDSDPPPPEELPSNGEPPGGAFS